MPRNDGGRAALGFIKGRNRGESRTRREIAGMSGINGNLIRRGFYLRQIDEGGLKKIRAAEGKTAAEFRARRRRVRDVRIRRFSCV